jgi:hypothetical protein
MAKTFNVNDDSGNPTYPFQYRGFDFFTRGPGASPFEVQLQIEAAQSLANVHGSQSLGHQQASTLKGGIAAYLDWIVFQRDTGCRISPPPVYTSWGGPGALEIGSGSGIGTEGITEKLFYWNSGACGTAGSFVGLTHSQGSGKWLDAIVRQIYVGETWRWSSRAYRACSNLLFQGITLEGNEQEHGFYHNMAGVGTSPGAGRLTIPAVTYENIRAIGVGAQIIQNVGACGRISETPDIAEDDTVGGDIILRDLYAERCTNEGAAGRASFSLSFYPSRNPVKVENVFVDASMLDPSYGMLLCEGMSSLAYWQGLPQNGYVVDMVTSLGARGTYDRSFTLDGGVFLTYRPNRDIFQFNDMRDVVIRDVHIDVDSGAAQRNIKFVNHTGTISMTGMSQAGGVHVWVNGVDQGVLGKTFLWP